MHLFLLAQNKDDVDVPHGLGMHPGGGNVGGLIVARVDLLLIVVALSN